MESPKRPRTRQSLAHPPSQDDGLSAWDQENVTTDIVSASALKSVGNAASKKSRSKSIGPGGVAALKEDAGNKRKVPMSHPKSILKPTIPLSPLREIPSRKVAADVASSPSRPKGATNERTSPGKIQSPAVRSSPRRATQKDADGRSDSQEDGIASNNSEQSELAASLQESAREERRKQREEIQKQRDARRKSMANRRVSFAPEATLHTWDLIDEAQDSTTSSASTNSTRRASAASTAGGATSPIAGRDITEVPSTPPKQMEDAEETLPESSPARQRDLHQKKNRRRSSTVLPRVDETPSSSSPHSGSSMVGDDGDIEMPDADAVEDGPIGSDAEENADAEQSVLDTPQRIHQLSSSRKEPNFDAENEEDMSMELAEDDITSAFQPFAKSTKMRRTPPATMGDKENVNPFSLAFQEAQPLNPELSSADDDRTSVGMDMTQVQGGILEPQSRGSGSAAKSSKSRRQSIRNRRRSSGGQSVGEGTMEFTTAVGTIQPESDEISQSDLDQNEELSMEFTGVIGGIQRDVEQEKSASRSAETDDNDPATLQLLSEERRASAEFTLNDNMEETTALGKINSAQPSVAPVRTVRDSITMDMTKAVGGFLGNGDLQQTPTQSARLVKASELDGPPSRSDFQERPRSSIFASAAGSPTRSEPMSGPRLGLMSTTQPIQSPPKSPQKSPQTPSKQITPKPVKAPSPAKPSPMKNVAMRTPSPRKLFKSELKRPQGSPAMLTPNIFHIENKTIQPGLNAHRDTVSSRNRRASEAGADKSGLGSPKVTSLLARRESIGKTAPILAPKDFFSSSSRFEDPKAMDAEVSHEREQEHRRESGQFILENETDIVPAEKDVTVTLKDAIQSMTPRKSKQKQKPRKSFATGSAKGVLGKRPAELDDDEEEDGTPKVLKGREESPVKKIRLAGPTAKPENVRYSLHGPPAGAVFSDHPFTPRTTSPTKTLLTTPKSQGRFKDAESLPSAQKPVPTMGQGRVSQDEIAEADGKEKISLQEFLNLTNVRFMDLTMTKRRHKAPPTPHRATPSKGEHASNLDDESQFFENCVVAGVCTIPMLELYQHSCRELKKYISEGRSIVREIEAYTLQDNPPLFREYAEASPAQRAVMDDQFKNMKTHARHLSKGMWYEWRMKLLESLKQGFDNVAAGMDADSKILDEQDVLLQSLLPEILREHRDVTQERERLSARANELAESNEEELSEARQQIVGTNQEIEAVKERIRQHQQTIEEADEAIETAQEAKIEHVQAIKEAQRVREEHRGWSVKEVNTLRANVEAMEARTGWSVTSADPARMKMTYQKQLELSFNAEDFAPLSSNNDQSQPINLEYVGEQNAQDSHGPRADKEFFLQLIRSQLNNIDRSSTHVRELLTLVIASWEKANAVAEEIAQLDKECPLHCDVAGEDRLLVTCMVLLKNVETKVNVTFEVHASTSHADLEVSVFPAAQVVYGEPYKSEKMREFLRSRVGKVVDDNHVGGSWAAAMMDLKRRLIAQGRKT